MAKQKKRYKAWSEASTKAWLQGNIEAAMDCWAEDCTRIGVDPFGDDWTIQGKEALREVYESLFANWSNRKILENKVLSANKDRGILHTWLNWTSKDGREMACTFISIVHLDKNDRCTKYMEWNVVEAKEADANG